MHIKASILAATLLATSAMGCAAGSETLTFDYAGTPEGLQAARTAANEWADVCGAVIAVGQGNGGLPLREVEGLLPGRLLGEVVSTADYRPKWMTVMKQPPLDEVATMAHEFGHALRIEHHTAVGLMRASYVPGLHVQPSDCALLP